MELEDSMEGKKMNVIQARKAIQKLYGPDAYARRYRGRCDLLLQIPTGEVLLGHADTFEVALEDAERAIRPEATAARIRTLEAQVAEMAEFIGEIKKAQEEAEYEARLEREHAAYERNKGMFGKNGIDEWDKD